MKWPFYPQQNFPGSVAPTFTDAVQEAHMRAALTRWRYRVTKDRANNLWQFTETTTRVGPEGVRFHER